MKALNFILVLSLFLAPIKGSAGPWNYISSTVSSYKQAKKYGIKPNQTYEYPSCQKFNEEGEAGETYFVSCNSERGILEADEINVLNREVEAIAVASLKEEFLDGLQEDVLQELTRGRQDLLELQECLQHNIESERCRQQKEGLLLGVRRDLPRARALAAQMHVPGKIYSPVKPERFQRKLQHPVSRVRPKDLSPSEAKFLAEHTDNLEERFRRAFIEENEDFNTCLQAYPCPGKEPIIDTHVSRAFDRQNKIYAEQYSSLVSGNPLLSLLKVRGDESAEEIFADVQQALSLLSQKSLDSINSIRALKGKKRNQLLGLGKGVDARLAQLDSKIYCDVAVSLKREMEFSELKTDLLIGAGALLGGGVCAFTLGAGCVLGVAVGAEAIALTVSQKRLQAAESYYYSGQGDAGIYERREWERNLSLFLAPLALVGEGAGTGVKALNRTFARTSKRASPSPSRRIDSVQRRLVNDIDAELGSQKQELLRKFNPGNIHKLNQADETYLAGIASLLRKRLKSASPDMDDMDIELAVRSKVNDLVKQCQGKE